MNSVRAFIAAWLNSSMRSRFGLQIGFSSTVYKNIHLPFCIFAPRVTSSTSAIKHEPISCLLDVDINALFVVWTSEMRRRE